MFPPRHTYLCFKQQVSSFFQVCILSCQFHFCGLQLGLQPQCHTHYYQIFAAYTCFIACNTDHIHGVHSSQHMLIILHILSLMHNMFCEPIKIGAHFLVNFPSFTTYHTSLHCAIWTPQNKKKQQAIIYVLFTVDINHIHSSKSSFSAPHLNTQHPQAPQLHSTYCIVLSPNTNPIIYHQYWVSNPINSSRSTFMTREKSRSPTDLTARTCRLCSHQIYQALSCTRMHNRQCLLQYIQPLMHDCAPYTFSIHHFLADYSLMNPHSLQNCFCLDVAALNLAIHLFMLFHAHL